MLITLWKEVALISFLIFLMCFLFLNFKATGIDMTEEEIDGLINRLDQDGDGEIDYGYVVFSIDWKDYYAVISGI